MAAALESKDPFDHMYVGHIYGTTEAPENAKIRIKICNHPYDDMSF
jgi:hypothetical protein